MFLVELGVLVVLPNKLFTGDSFKGSYFSRVVYESGLGLMCISKLFGLQRTFFNSLTIFWAHIVFQA